MSLRRKNIHGKDSYIPLTRTWGQLERTIHAKAWRLVKRYGFSEADREDIEQEMWLGVLMYRNRYAATGTKPDSGVAWVGDFDVIDAQRVIAVLCGRMWRRFKQRRDNLTVTSDASINGQRDSLELHLMRLDVEQLVRVLPDELRLLCDRLKNQSQEDDIPLSNGVPCPMTEAKLVCLRCIFRTGNLHEYLN